MEGIQLHCLRKTYIQYDAQKSASDTKNRIDLAAYPAVWRGWHRGRLAFSL
jgi:hypothetical protein